MTNPDQALEATIVAAGANVAPRITPANVAPRITPADIAASIYSMHFFSARQGAQAAQSDVTAFDHEPLSLLTFCVLVLHNGFTVTGESACASPENFNAEIGRRIACENAMAKIWPLLGYELRSKLAGV